jgi:hypothetical protein
MVVAFLVLAKNSVVRVVYLYLFRRRIADGAEFFFDLSNHRHGEIFSSIAERGLEVNTKLFPPLFYGVYANK